MLEFKCRFVRQLRTKVHKLKFIQQRIKVQVQYYCAYIMLLHENYLGTTGVQTEVKEYKDCAIQCNLFLAPPLHSVLESSCSEPETSADEELTEEEEQSDFEPLSEKLESSRR